MTAASSRLGLSQSATSHALSRIRAALQDDLLVRQGNAMVPTPRARAIEERLPSALRQLEVAIESPGEFEPRTSTRSFRLACPDLVATLIPDVLGSIRTDAPRIRIEIESALTPPELEGLQHERIDLGLGLCPEPSSGLHVHRLGAVQFAVASRHGHAFMENPTLDDWAASSHVTVRTGRDGQSIVGTAAREHGVQRHIALRAANFLLAVHTAASTDLLFSAPEALLRPLADWLPIELAPLPVSIDPVPIAGMWAESEHKDQGHQWFRERVLDTLELHLGRE